MKLRNTVNFKRGTGNFVYPPNNRNMSTNNFIHLVEHKKKFKPVLDEISQLDISYSNSLKYKSNYIFKENSEQLYFKNLNLKNFHTDPNFNWDQLEVMKTLNCKPQLYLNYFDYNPIYLLDINYILHNIIEYNLVQVGMTNIFMLSIILNYMSIIKLKIFNFLNFIQKNFFTTLIIFTLLINIFFGIDVSRYFLEFIRENFIELNLYLSNIILGYLFYIILDGFLNIIKLLNRIIDILDKM